ncbi:MAG: serine--tRNA ligase [Candidatus Diapherotrites archaeon]|nr:serine--tRNA ligase [Candidatus Diapherotrites archaeon]
MIEIDFVRKNPEKVRENLSRRNNSEFLGLFDDFLKKDTDYRNALQNIEALKRNRNDLTKQVQVLMKDKKDAKKAIAEAKKVSDEIKSLEVEVVQLKESSDSCLKRLPNLLHDSVPFGKDDSENVVVKTYGKKPKLGFEIKHHGEFAVSLNGADFERAVKISGSGFYFLKNEIALLDLALSRLGIDLLLKKGFSLIQPPLLLKKEPYEGVIEMDAFENVMYKIEGSDSYLIATSEHPMVSMHMNEIFSEHDLPIKYAGLSPCFRKEIGKHGLDERGLFRVHQFNKVEQVVFCKPEDSKKIHEELLQNSVDLLNALELHFNVVNVCTGDIGYIASKKYDVNAYSPREDKFIELMSCSNCTSYQANRLGIKFRPDKGEKQLVHTLNNTMIATSRALRIILENYQQADGSLKIPKALLPYMNGMKEITPKKLK